MAVKKFERGEKSQITDKRVEALAALDFKWNARSAGWDRHFEDLQKFKQEHGHCYVPRSNKGPNKSLGYWVNNIRSKQIRSSAEQTSRLNSIGFKWSMKK